MRHVLVVIAMAVLVAIVCVMFAAAAHAAPAYGSAACTVAQAKHELRVAHRAAVRAAARERAARHVLSATKHFSAQYSAAVGRWTRLVAREFGYGPLDQAMYIVWRESRGDPRATNPSSNCSGLFQLHPLHWSGKFDPYIPALNVAYAAKLYRGSGWAPWAIQ